MGHGGPEMPALFTIPQSPEIKVKRHDTEWDIERQHNTVTKGFK